MISETKSGQVVAILFSITVLQLLFANYFPWGLEIDLTLLAVVFIGRYSSPVRGTIWGSLFGLTQDIVLMGPYWGLNGLSKTLIGFANSYSRWLALELLPGQMATIAVLSLVDGIIVHGLLYLLGNATEPWLWAALTRKALLTAFLGVILFRAYDRLQYRKKDFRRPKAQ